MCPIKQETALDVVDSSGQNWPVTAESYQPNDAQLTLIFDEPLPAGQYSLIVPASGGLTDLAGVPVVATGEPAGVLASWTVARRRAEATQRPGRPLALEGRRGLAHRQWLFLRNHHARTRPGGDLSLGRDRARHLHAANPGRGKLDRGREFRQRQRDRSRRGKHQRLEHYLMTLTAGVYELRLTNVGSQQAEVQWLLKIESLDWEKIIDNGVSQSSALSLMTFAPTLASPDTGTGFLSIPPSAVGDASGSSAGPVPSSLLVTLNTALTGQPSWDGQAVSGAGLVADAGAIATAGGPTGQALPAGYVSLFAPGADRTTTTWT